MIQERFIGAVGKMPFSGKHGIKTFYADGYRAAIRGDAEGKQKSEDNIRVYMQFNIRRCLSGIALAGLGIVLNEAYNTQQFVPETAAGAVIAAGYGASLLAEQLILRRLQARSLNPLPQAPVEPTPIPPPTHAETIVADIGPRVVGIASAAHVTIYSLAQASQGFLQ